MHIAICDDDIAHRKHFERLMKRESNARKVVDTSLYIDSFGSEEALLFTPMQYDIFFLSISSESLDVYALVKQLRTVGVSVPIAIVKLPDHTYDCTEFDNIHYMNDPLRPSEIHDILQIGFHHMQNSTRLYEIHGIYETRYLSEEQMLYADVRENGKYTLHLVDQSTIDCDMPLEDFYYMLESSNMFVYNGKKAVFNLRYMKNMTFRKVELIQDIILPISLSEIRYIRNAWNQFLQEKD